jgi:hypothetical protein
MVRLLRLDIGGMLGRMNSASALPGLPDLARSAYNLTHELPWFHTFTRPFRGARVRREAEKFVRLVYSIDLKNFREIEDFELVDRWIQVVITTVERFVAWKYGPEDTGECAVFQDLIRRLQVASEGVRAGLPPDPAKRPDPAKLKQDAEERLGSVLHDLGLSSPRSAAGVR